MPGFARKAGVHDQRVQPDKTPAGFIEAPVVVADDLEKILPVFLARRLWRHRADRGRVVADVVIAGQVTAGNRQRVVQRLGEGEIVRTGRGIEGEIAAVDDEIGTRRVDLLADAIKIFGERWQAAGEVGVGNLAQAKLVHAIFLSAPIISLSATE